jgi:hypothetical protein
MMSSAPTNSSPAVDQAFCAICQTEIGPREKRTHCPECKVSYHVDCWTDNGGCAIYGCAAVPPTEKLQDVEVPVSYWGKEDKACPACGQSIVALAIRCRYCGATFESSRPRDRHEFVADAIRKQRTPQLSKHAIWVLVTGLIPFTAPLCLIVGGIWFLRNRKELRELPATSRAMAMIGLGVAGLQTIFLVLVFVLTPLIA